MSHATTTTANTADTNEAAIIVTNSKQEQQRRLHNYYRKIARYPLGTFWLDSLRLFSPWTWDGLAMNRKMFHDGISIFKTAWQSFLGILLPVAFYKTTFELTTFLSHRISTIGSSLSAVAAEAIANQAATTATAIALSSTTAQDFTLSTADSSSSTTASVFLSALCSAMMSMPAPKQLLLVYLLSPWTISWMLRGVGPVVQATLAVASARSMHRRTRALPEAWQVLSTAIEEGRAYRTRKYDAYLPLLTTTASTTVIGSSDNGEQTNASCVASVPALSTVVYNHSQHQQQLRPGNSVILLIPGSGLDPTGYAQPAKMLSDCGHVVIVLSSEPLRMASPSLGFTSAYGKRLIQQVNRELNAKLVIHHRPLPPPPTTKTTTTTTPNESMGSQPQQPLEPPVPPRERTFHLLGHSLGAFTASHWVEDLNTTKLILWAALPVFSEYLNDLRGINNNIDKNGDNDDDDDDALQVLVLQASNDGILQFMMETTPPHILAQRTKTFWQRLPQGRARGNVQQRLLMGATHNGFASHEAGYFLTRPEIQDISRLQQQHQAVAMTHEFLVRQ